MVERGYNRASGPGGLVEWYMRVKAGRFETDEKVAIHIVDRRLNPGSRVWRNRQRFLASCPRRWFRGAVKKVPQRNGTSGMSLEGGEVSIPARRYA